MLTPFSRSLTRLSALLVGASLMLLPVSAAAMPQAVGIPAVSAPSPLSLEDSNSRLYRATCRRLSALGMNEQQCAILYSRLGPQLTQQLDQDVWSLQELAFLSLPNCHPEWLNRYLDYAQANPEQSLLDVAVQVNLGLDRPFYEEPDVISDPSDPLVLVNKYHSLPQDYVPELMELGATYGTGSLTPEAAQAFFAMADAAREDGISLRSVSAYRSYSYQEQLYERYVDQSGTEAADTFSARPGYSEHQTGLALDINTASSSAHFEESEEFAWLEEHCAQFGFLLRYPQGKQDITGYRFEPWHYRYVGIETAQRCVQLGLTYDEYLAYQSVPGPYPLPDDALPSSTPSSNPPILVRN